MWSTDICGGTSAIKEYTLRQCTSMAGALWARESSLLPDLPPNVSFSIFNQNKFRIFICGLTPSTRYSILSQSLWMLKICQCIWPLEFILWFFSPSPKQITEITCFGSHTSHLMVIVNNDYQKMLECVCFSSYFNFFRKRICCILK